MKRQADLLQVVGATHAVRGFTDFLHGRHEKTDKDRNDGNDHEQFNQGERPAIPHGRMMNQQETLP